jgi:transposase
MLHAPLSRDHLAVISGVTASGRLLVQVREQPFRGPTIADFLRHLVRHIPGKLLVIGDGAPIHRAQPVKDFLATEQGQRVWLECLPGYAPEVNPDEGVWQHLKRVELRKLVCKDLSDLKQELLHAIAQLRHKRHVLRGCFSQCGYIV